MNEQKVIFKIKNNEDGTQNIGITFDPELAGENTDEFLNMTDEEKELQCAGAHVAGYVMSSLDQNNIPDDDLLDVEDW